jgi:hypothetical protein
MDAKDRRNVRRGQPFEFMHDNDRPTPWREEIKGAPHCGVNDKRAFRVIGGVGDPWLLDLVSCAHLVSTPLVAPKIDQHADQPRFLVGHVPRNGTE